MLLAGRSKPLHIFKQTIFKTSFYTLSYLVNVYTAVQKNPYCCKHRNPRARRQDQLVSRVRQPFASLAGLPLSLMV